MNLVYVKFLQDGSLCILSSNTVDGIAQGTRTAVGMVGTKAEEYKIELFCLNLDGVEANFKKHSYR